ncbi:MAG: acyl-CoA-binding protein [Flavobacteriaceae bacterium]|nr:acyl-CoA-binding protein [Flavobacteriaceae bacterium]
MDDELNNRLEKAYAIASDPDFKVAPDVMLKLYAYYKQATLGDKKSVNIYDSNVRNAFKMNAWFQASGVSKQEAKEKYIEIVEEIIKSKL